MFIVEDGSGDLVDAFRVDEEKLTHGVDLPTVGVDVVNLDRAQDVIVSVDVTLETLELATMDELELVQGSVEHDLGLRAGREKRSCRLGMVWQVPEVSADGKRAVHLPDLGGNGCASPGPKISTSKHDVYIFVVNFNLSVPVFGTYLEPWSAPYNPRGVPHPINRIQAGRLDVPWNPEWVRTAVAEDRTMGVDS
ncbi:hypothetical protein HFD88_005560 [Aspergillus terreus]|nr:hypothetical protein HFD88_005560 [Aspergillus terreus]